VRAFEKIEQRGVLIDMQAYKALEVEAKAEVKKLTTEAFALIPHKIKAKHYPKLKLSRAALKIDYLFGPDGLGLTPKVWTKGTEKKPPDERIPSVSIDDHLSQFAGHKVAGKFVGILKELGKVDKVLTNYIGTKNAAGDYVKGFLTHLRPDGRFHPTYMLYAGALFEGKDDTGGTVTGRTSAKNPAIQTLSKHGSWAKKLRRCYISPEGMLCWQIDFSQGELRVAACLANEKAMIDAYRKGVDVHAMTAAANMGVPLKEFVSWEECGDKELEAKYEVGRQKAKAVNFGFLYTMGAKGFVKYAWKGYEVVVSLKEAQEAQDQFFSTYPGLHPWHDKQRAAAHRDKAVRSPLGRIRHLPHIDSTDDEIVARAERQAINSPVQSCLSDLCLWAAARIEERFDDREERFHTVGMTHDSLNGYGRIETIEADLAEAVGVVNSLPIRDTFEWKHQIPFPVDAEIGPSMGALKKFKIAA
jgi:DNA polymerase I-like protein with 3'-5' exonuclease and polymerase domains